MTNRIKKRVKQEGKISLEQVMQMDQGFISNLWQNLQFQDQNSEVSKKYFQYKSEGMMDEQALVNAYEE